MKRFCTIDFAGTGIRFLRINSDNSTDELTAAQMRAAQGLGTLATQSGTFSGNSSGTNTGDQTITLTGDVTGSGTGSFAATLAANVVTLAKFQQLAARTMVGNVTAGTANGTALTATQVNMVGDASYTTTVSSVSNVTLTVASTTKQRFTGSAAQPLTLPVTSTLNLGHRFTVINDGSAAITVKSSGTKTIATIAAGQTGIFTCVLTSGTTEASWSYSVAQSAHAALTGLTGIGTSWTQGGLEHPMSATWQIIHQRGQQTVAVWLQFADTFIVGTLTLNNFNSAVEGMPAKAQAVET